MDTEIFQCPHCGAEASAHAVDCPACGRVVAAGACPRGCGLLRTVTVASAVVEECPRCAGQWVRRETLHRICRDPGAHPELFASTLPPAVRHPVRARAHDARCPECRRALHRLSFGRRSGVMVELCTRHGLWFDPDDLRRALEFVRQGGLEGVE